MPVNIQIHIATDLDVFQKEKHLLHDRNHLRWGAVSAVFANPLCIVYFCPVENGDVIVAAVVIPFHVELLKLHLNNLQQQKIRANS